MVQVDNGLTPFNKIPVDTRAALGYNGLINKGMDDMELFDVSFGDSYEHRSVGLALSLEAARDLARAFLVAEDNDHYRNAVDSGSYWFYVTRRQVGVVSDVWAFGGEPLDL